MTRRRALMTLGFVYMAIMLSFDAIARSGIAQGIPVLGWGTPGPFSASWMTATLIRHSIAAAIFLFIMSRFLPARLRED